MDPLIVTYLDTSAHDAAHAGALRQLLEHSFELLILLSNPLVGDALTSSDERLRYRGSLLVAELLEGRCSSLSSSAVHTLLQFFCSRIADQPSVVPCLIAFRPLLLKSPDVSEDDIKHTLRALFNELMVQSLAQSIRQRFYDLALALLRDERLATASSGMGEEVTRGMLAALQGERDPRCLLLCFQILDLLPKRYGQLMEESTRLALFEASACYFPITFEPPVDDPHGVTAGALINGLLSSLTSHPVLLNYSPSFFLDQLAGDSLAAGKTQAMDGFIRLAELHGPAVFRPLLPELAEQLHSIIVSAPQSDSSGAALKVITEICRHIKDYDCFLEFGEILLSNVALEIQNGFDGAQAAAAVMVAGAIAESSFNFSTKIFSRLAPIFSNWIAISVKAVRQSLIASSNDFASEHHPDLSVNSFVLLKLLVKSVEPHINYLHSQMDFEVLRPIINSFLVLLTELSADMLTNAIDSSKFLVRDVTLLIRAVECLEELIKR